MRRSFFLSLLFLSGCRTTKPPKRTVRKVRKPAVRQKQIFIVIDDAGQSMPETQAFLDIPIPMTIAVLPHLKETRQVCQAIQQTSNKEIILHQPMEAYNASANPGPGAIYSTASPADVTKILSQNLANVPGAIGINNHMGSRITENESLMTVVLRNCKARHLFFLDSKTAYNSVVPRVAKQERMHLEQRDVFLDLQHDQTVIRKAWSSTVAKARTNGYTIAIGHAWSPETAATIRDSYQTLLNQGYTFHCLSELYS